MLLIKVYGVPGWGSTISELMLTLADILISSLISVVLTTRNFTRVIENPEPVVSDSDTGAGNDEIMTEAAAIALMVLDRHPDLAPPLGRRTSSSFNGYWCWLVANVYQRSLSPITLSVGHLTHLNS